MRLDILKQEGKVPEQALYRMTLDQMIEMFKERKETLDKLNDQYRLGRIPRILITNFKNISLFLDWAFRTQEIQLSDDPKFWIDFTTYSTNGMKVKFSEKEKNQLVLHFD